LGEIQLSLYSREEGEYFGDHHKQGSILGSYWNSEIGPSPPIRQVYRDEGWKRGAVGDALILSCELLNYNIIVHPLAQNVDGVLIFL
jgi:hypothetical protein